jgi:hypothetical protein
MPGFHRDSHKHGGNKQRVLLDGATYEPGPAARPRAFQQPSLSPAPFLPRSGPESPVAADLPLWPGWHEDPTGRHETRYFDGVSWTDNVQDGAVPSHDPFEGSPSSEESAQPASALELGGSFQAREVTDGNGHADSNGADSNGADSNGADSNGAASNGHVNGNGNGEENGDDHADSIALLLGGARKES